MANKDKKSPAINRAEHISIDDGENINAKRSGIYGYDLDNQSWSRVSVNQYGEINSSQPIQRTAFGETKAAPSIAYIEGSATYGLIPANFRQFTSGTGSTDAFTSTVTWYEDL